MIGIAMASTYLGYQTIMIVSLRVASVSWTHTICCSLPTFLRVCIWILLCLRSLNETCNSDVASVQLTEFAYILWRFWWSAWTFQTSSFINFFVTQSLVGRGSSTMNEWIASREVTVRTSTHSTDGINTIEWYETYASVVTLRVTLLCIPIHTNPRYSIQLPSYTYSNFSLGLKCHYMREVPQVNPNVTGHNIGIRKKHE